MEIEPETLEGYVYHDNLIGALKHPEPLTRMSAAWLLGKTGEARTVDTWYLKPGINY